MGRPRASSVLVREFILDHLEAHAHDIVRLAAAHFACSRQAAHKHLHRLIEEGFVTATGRTRSTGYHLATLGEWRREYAVSADLAEDAVWRRDVAPALGALPANALGLWRYGFTEMFNNVVGHAAATSVAVLLRLTAATAAVEVRDNGVGIFTKIQAALGLDDERHAVLELAKGKLTTDPAHHSGEGIFFTSRMFDEFDIVSGGVRFSHTIEQREDWIRATAADHGGTLVRMLLHHRTDRTTQQIFDQYTTGDDFGFTKTIVPVRLMEYGDDNLVSRSQAKRLLARIERFKVVTLDFAGVEGIGQAFADEVFRVFRAQHPTVELVVANASEQVLRWISRAEVLGGAGEA